MGSISIFIIYMHEDKELLEILKELYKYLNVLKRTGLIDAWYDQSLQSGMDRKRGINEHLESADIILPLIDNNFLMSDYYSNPEIKRALERLDAGEVSVIPILLTLVDLEETPFKQLPILPTEGKAVTEWQDRDEVLTNIAEGIGKAVTTIRISSLAKEKLPTIIQDEQTKDVTPKKTVEFRGCNADLEEIAAQLQQRKERHHRTALVLGARTGGFFRSSYLYEILRLFSPHHFSDLSHLEQFSECYSILARPLFNKVDTHSILQTSLQDVAVTKADIHLAKLAKRGYFDEIITTNTDDILEQSLLQIGMREYRDFEVFTPVGVMRSRLQTERSSSFRISKMFSNLASRNYDIDPDGIGNRTIRNFVQPILAREILVIGIDPLWDKELLRAIPAGERVIWFVNEEAVPESSIIADLQQARPIEYVGGKNGGYEYFMTNLYATLLETSSLNASGDDSNILHQLRVIQNELRTLKDQIADLQSSKINSSPSIQFEG